MENPTIFQKVRANRSQCFLIHSLNTDITFCKRISTLHPIDQSTPSLTAPPLDKTCIDCASVISLLFDKNEIWGNKLLLLFGYLIDGCFSWCFPAHPEVLPSKGRGRGFLWPVWRPPEMLASCMRGAVCDGLMYELLKLGRMWAVFSETYPSVIFALLYFAHLIVP